MEELLEKIFVVTYTVLFLGTAIDLAVQIRRNGWPKANYQDYHDNKD
jgi:hypothetical protein